MTTTVANVLERPLAAGETALAVPGTPMILSQTFDGPLDVPALRAALADLSTIHPVLTARILPGAGGHILRRSPSATAPALELAPPDTPPDPGAQAAAAPFALGTPLLRALLHTGPDASHRFTMVINHAIADGTSFLALYSTLWQRYNAHTTGPPPEIPPAAPCLPPPVEESIADRFTPQDLAAFLERRARRLQASPCARMPSLAAGPAGPGPEPGVHLHRVDLSAGQVTRLTAVARDADTTLHMALCGVTLTAIRTQIPGPPTPLTLTCMSTVDIRPRLQPRIPRDRLVMAVAVPDMSVDVTPDTDPLRTGALLWKQLKADAADGTIDRTVAAMPHLLAEATTEKPMTVFISNVINRSPLHLPHTLTAGPRENFTYAPGPVPAVFFSDTPDDGVAITLVLPRAWYTTDQTRALAQAITDTLTHTLLED
jgi:hypothetical protein